MSAVIEAHGLVKRYGAATVVDGVDLSLDEGEVLGLLGPNGAGKTTTILMLLGLTEPSAGQVRVLGLDPLRAPLKVKNQVGYLPDSVGFYDNLSGRENLMFTARLGGFDPAEAKERIAVALDKVRLGAAAHRRVGAYSHGMRQRLGLAELLMRDTRVIILDEPTSGLDPQSTEELLDLIRGFAKEGMSVILSSHLLDVVQSICSRVALFNKGRVGFVGTVEALAEQVTDGAFHIDVSADGADMDALLGGVDGVHQVQKQNGSWHVTAASDIRAELAKRIVAAGGALKELDAHRVSLSEAYNLFFKEMSNEA